MRFWCRTHRAFWSPRTCDECGFCCHLIELAGCRDALAYLALYIPVGCDD
jgi:hypothetical protein